MKAYEGNEKYIFVSYSHKDSNQITPIINELDRLGFRVWYDTGIEAGTEWPAYIEDHLTRSEVVLVLMSPHAVESINCRNEINYATAQKKEILVVYLTETELAKGMNLQLSSLQSMFKYRHESFESFISELSKAKILECCRNGNSCQDSEHNKTHTADSIPQVINIEYAHNSGNRELIIKSRERGPSLISTVGTKPSNNPSDPWPDTDYTNVINSDLFTAIHFHCNLVKKFPERNTVTAGIFIFNERDALVYENSTSILFEPGHDRFSYCWVIRNPDGMTMVPGIYTAIIWVDSSQAVEYKFKIISPRNQLASTPKTTDANDNRRKGKKAILSPEEAELRSLKGRLRVPVIFVFSLIAQLVFLTGLLLFYFYEGTFDYIEAFISILVNLTIGLLIPVCIMTKNNLIRNGFLAFLAVYLGCGYYHIFLTVMLIITLVNKKRWLKRVDELEKIIAAKNSGI